MTRRTLEQRVNDLFERMTGLQMDHASKIQKLKNEKARLEARMRGETSMGTKDERLAFMRAIEAHNGFGFSYAQALTALQKMAEGSNMDNADRMAALEIDGQALMQRHLPKHRITVDPSPAVGLLTGNASSSQDDVVDPQLESGAPAAPHWPVATDGTESSDSDSALPVSEPPAPRHWMNKELLDAAVADVKPPAETDWA